MEKILTHDFGKSFPPAMSFAGYIFLLSGLIALTTNYVLGGLFIFLGIFIAFTRSGVQINTDNMTYRSYNSIFSIKQGKWKSLSDWKYISLLRSKVVTAAYSRSYRRAVTSDNVYYEITLLDKSHRKKCPIKRSTDKNKAIEELSEFSILLGIPKVKFNPHKNIFSS